MSRATYAKLMLVDALGCIQLGQRRTWRATSLYRDQDA
jgi:hypothetical protein